MAPRAPRRSCSAICLGEELALPVFLLRRPRQAGGPAQSCGAAGRTQLSDRIAAASWRPTSARAGCYTQRPGRCWSAARAPLVAFNVELARARECRGRQADRGADPGRGRGGARRRPGDRRCGSGTAASRRSPRTSRTTWRRRSARGSARSPATPRSPEPSSSGSRRTARSTASPSRFPCATTARSRNFSVDCLTRALKSSGMAQTKRKRRSKHRGTAAGTIDARGRTGRPPSADEQKQLRVTRRARSG